MEAKDTHQITVTVLPSYKAEDEGKAQEIILSRQLWYSTILWNNTKAENERAIENARQIRKVTPSSTSHYGSGACGGNLPPCSVMMCESRGNLTAHNPSGADGKWQIIPPTWNNYKGYATPSSAPEEIQDEKAAIIYAGGSGRGQWVC